IAPPWPRARRRRTVRHPHRPRVGRAAAPPRARAERLGSAGRGRDLSIRRFLELARSVGLDGAAPAARLGRTPRLSRPDELLGAAGLPGPASHGAAARRAAAPAPQLAPARSGGRRRLDLLRRACLARPAPPR